MLAVVFGVLSGALFGVFTLAVRSGLTRGADPEVGAFVITGLGFLVGALLALPELVGGAGVADLWPFLAVGAVVPGASQILFILVTFIQFIFIPVIFAQFIFDQILFTEAIFTQVSAIVFIG